MTTEILKGDPHCTHCPKDLSEFNYCKVCFKGYPQWHDDGESKIHSWQEQKVGREIEYSPDGRVIGSEYKTYGQIFKR